MTLDLEAIKKRAEAATPGPWRWDDEGHKDEEGEAGAIVGEEGALVVSAYNYHCCEFPEDPHIRDENREFISHARSDVPALISEVERLREEVEWRTSDSALAKILSDLDRCEHGRHEGDICSGRSGCNGPSHGNPIAAEHERYIGYDLSRRPIRIPSREHMHNPDAWFGES